MIHASEVEPALDNFAALCKSCGAGTLNNRAIPHFALIDGYDEFEDQLYIQCRGCGSTHVNVVVL
jgi:hypothetical protein